MHLIARSLIFLLFTPLLADSKVDSLSSCLPEGVTLSRQIVEEVHGPTNEKPKPKTLQSRLSELKAQCKNRKLVSRSGKEIRIVQLIGCWGNPPEDYQEQLDRQQRELKELKEKYIVIEIPCTLNKTIARSMFDML